MYLLKHALAKIKCIYMYIIYIIGTTIDSFKKEKFNKF